MEPKYCPWMNETVLFLNDSLKNLYEAKIDSKIDLI